MTAAALFAYPNTPHRRRHGPMGYAGVSSYKPWLRDEFEFRCVFCCLRETWFPNGSDALAVEHLEPRARSPERTLVYDNLLYACARCNSHKLDHWPVMNPCEVALGLNIKVNVNDDGTIEALTREGRRLVRLLHLDEPDLTRFRNRLFRLIRHLQSARDNEAATILYLELLGYPNQLPDLSVLHPRSNSRPEGVRFSHYERRKRGELPDVY